MTRHWPYMLVFIAGAVGALVFQYFVRLGQAPAEPEDPPRVDLSVVSGGTYRVARVVDGDTIVLENGLHVRYAGINAPETGRWVKDDPAPQAREATARNRELVEGRLVRLTLGTAPVDAYGRLLAHVARVAEGEPEVDVEAVLLKEGLARVLALGLAAGEYARLKAWQEEAKAAKAGLWGVTAPAVEREADFLYCAAAGSKTFHRVDCPLAQRISPANVQRYATREQVETTGRKPCSQCLKSETPATKSQRNVPPE